MGENSWGIFAGFGKPAVVALSHAVPLESSVRIPPVP